MLHLTPLYPTQTGAEIIKRLMKYAVGNVLRNRMKTIHELSIVSWQNRYRRIGPANNISKVTMCRKLQAHLTDEEDFAELADAGAESDSDIDVDFAGSKLKLLLRLTQVMLD